MKKKGYITPKTMMVTIPVESHLCAGTSDIVGVGDREATEDAQSAGSTFFDDGCFADDEE